MFAIKFENSNRQIFIVFAVLLCLSMFYAHAQTNVLDSYNVVWTSQSKNSSESMPCGGGDIGLNVWVEKGDLFFYISRSGAFDENNGFLKLGRVRVRLNPNPFEGKEFSQKLVLNKGHIEIKGKAEDLSVSIIVWVDVFNPVAHVEILANKPVKAEAAYESWRYDNHILKAGESFENSLKWGPVKNVTTQKDNIDFKDNGVLFYHRNMDSTVFDITVRQQGLNRVKNKMYNPLINLTFGGYMQGTNMIPAGNTNGTYIDTDFKGWKIESKKEAKRHVIKVYTHIENVNSLDDWENNLQKIVSNTIDDKKNTFDNTLEWWDQFWNRSYVVIQPESTDETNKVWQVGRNYQLFRYMLGCNAYGTYPTKFNGGLFTYDPVFTDASKHFTPDYRNWCGGVMTAQNQRLVYFPMIKSGDFDMLKSQFNFYTRSIQNAELRSEVYWGHKGACFTEQLESFGLPNSAEYGWWRPDYFDNGVEYNAWLEYEWDTVLEFCLMMLEKERYSGANINEYIPFIKSCLVFFDEHYQYLAKHRGSKTLDSNGHLILYPGSGAETFKMAYNSTSTIAALGTVLSRFLELPASYSTDEERKEIAAMLNRIPPLNFREFDGHKTISPAKSWERVNNTEPSQLYPVFPWGIYGVGKPDLNVAINTWKYDTLAIQFRSHVGWKQDNIWAARLGLTDEASKLAIFKLQDSGRRFPAFWGPGFDWTPDHNWGGSGMIGLQEMLMQVNGEKIYLFPAWPKTWDVHFKLHAPYNTTVECILKNGKLELLKVIPKERGKDVVDMISTP
jgi:hypothetical protein